jgi:uncharacterized protein
MVASLVFVLEFDLHAHIDIIIGITMVSAAAIRMNYRLRTRISKFVEKWDTAYLLCMGVIHGFTNMGGALLSIYATARHKDKCEIRTTIATYYLAFGLLQLVTIALLRPEFFNVHRLLAALIALAVYFLVGPLAFNAASAPTYDKAITSFIASYAVAVLVKAGL